eukprot:snap_masked-scaffold_36-processed-gene-2.87-mRNA-1 protein AED:0.01 eAED:0.01 QI:0/-1/0/1/-1/1/1/0/395
MISAILSTRRSFSVLSKKGFYESIKDKIIEKSVASAISELSAHDSETSLGNTYHPTFLSPSKHVENLSNKNPNLNPFQIVSNDISEINSNIRSLLSNNHPVLTTVANYFFEDKNLLAKGKKIRPTLVLLFSKFFSTSENYSSIKPKHLRLAEITEMMHTASLLHDDVIDLAGTRRGVKSVNQEFGNKLAVLAGDFLLARSSTHLARLGDIQVVETLATVLEHLVKGEILQMHDERGKSKEDFIRYYLEKNYLKTGSLMANSILGTCMLAGADEDTQKIAFEFGECFGQAFQLIDDCLDYEGSEKLIGKPVLNDIKLGLITGPVLLSDKFDPSLNLNVREVDRVLDVVHSGNGIENTKKLATQYVNKAIQAIEKFESSENRDGLISLAFMILDRQK